MVCTDQLERMTEAGRIDMRYLRVLNNQDVRGFPLFLSAPLYPEWSFAALPVVPNDVAAEGWALYIMTQLYLSHDAVLFRC